MGAGESQSGIKLSPKEAAESKSESDIKLSPKGAAEKKVEYGLIGIIFFSAYYTSLNTILNTF